MSKATGYTPENDAVAWRDLADQIFPLEALRTKPAVHPLASPSSGGLQAVPLGA